MTFAGVNDTYVCKSKEINAFGYKDEFILFWNNGYFEQQFKAVESTPRMKFVGRFDVHEKNYFTATSAYQDGHVLSAFNGTTFVSVFIKAKYTAVSEYTCSKF